MKVNNIRVGLIISYIALAVNSIIHILYTPIMLRLLGQNEYGLYSLSTSIVGYLNVLGFGFVNAYLRYYYKYKVENNEEKIADLNGVYLIVFTIIGVISFVVGLIITLNVDSFFGESLTTGELEKAKILVFVLVINISLSFPLGIFSYYLTANEKFIFLKSLNLAQTVLLPVLMIIVLFFGFKSVGMTVVTLVVTLTMNLLQLYYCFNRCGYKITFSIKNLRMFKEIFIFSSYVFLNIVAEQLNWQADKLILARYLGTAQVAVYGIGSQIHTIFLSIASNITTVVKPKVNNLVLSGNKRELDDLFLRIGRIQFIVLVLILTGFFFFGKQFIFFWAGKEYADSYAIALLLLFPLTLAQMLILSTEVQRAKNLHKFRSIVLFSIAIVNVVISIPLCKLYGGIGCAAGTAASVLIGSVGVMSFYNQKVVGLKITGLFKSVGSLLPALIAPLIAGIAINRFINTQTIVNFILFGIIYVGIYFVSMWIFGFNQYEKDLIIKPVNRLVKRRFLK